MQQHTQRISRNGRAAAVMIVGGEGRASINLSLNLGRPRPLAIGLTIAQAEGMVDALRASLGDLARTREDGHFPRRQAANGRANAAADRAYGESLVALAVGIGGNRYLRYSLTVPEAEGAADALARALADTEAHRAGEGA